MFSIGRFFSFADHLAICVKYCGNLCPFDGITHFIYVNFMSFI